MSCVRDRGTSAEGSRNDGGFSECGFGGPSLTGVAAVNVNAVGALSCERDCDRDKFLYFAGVVPSATAILWNAQKAFIASGARAFSW
jgi:hypothetical protein